MVTREQIERSINADYCRKEIRRGIKVICIALISLIIYALVGILLLQDWLFTLSMVGILGGILCCIFFLKGYMGRLKAKPKKESSGKPGFGAHATTALFVGLCATFVGSYVGRAVHADWMPLAVALIAGAVMGVLEYLTHKKGMVGLENFSLAASMLAAMAAAVGLGLIA